MSVCGPTTVDALLLSGSTCWRFSILVVGVGGLLEGVKNIEL
jgi:hypothetical protein